MSAFVKVGLLTEFKEGRGRAVEIDGRRVAVFNMGGRLFALQDDCPHMGASLADGQIEDGRVRCHMHGWVFELESGQGCPPAKSWACARTYEARVENGAVFLRKPEPKPQPKEPDWPRWDDDMLK